MAMICADCPADISHRGRAAKRCLMCARQRTREAAIDQRHKESKDRQMARSRRRCAGCAADISHRWKAKRCEPCAEKAVRECRRRGRGQEEERCTCADCDADISALHFNAKRCERCRAAFRAAGRRRWQEANRDAVRAAKKRRYQPTPEYLASRRECERRRYRANPEESRERKQRWRARNPERTREILRRRRAKVMGTSPRRYRFLLYAIQGGLCGICLKEMDGFGGDEMHVDHVIPLALGGPDIFANWQAAHASCNLSKGASGRPLPDDVGRSIRRALDIAGSPA